MYVAINIQQGVYIPRSKRRLQHMQHTEFARSRIKDIHKVRLPFRTIAPRMLHQWCMCGRNGPKTSGQAETQYDVTTESTGTDGAHWILLCIAATLEHCFKVSLSAPIVSRHLLRHGVYARFRQHKILLKLKHFHLRLQRIYQHS